MKLYRYERGRNANGVYIWLWEMQVEKETPAGYRIFFNRWVSKTAKKRFAYPTIEEAQRNFMKRTHRCRAILQSRIDDTDAILAWVEANEFPKESGCGM